MREESTLSALLGGRGCTPLPLRRAPRGCPTTLTLGTECGDSRAGTPFSRSLSSHDSHGSLPGLEVGSSSLCITGSLPSEPFRAPPPCRRGRRQPLIESADKGGFVALGRCS